MKYECILKVKSSVSSGFETKFRGIHPSYEEVVAKFEKWWEQAKKDYIDYVILVNKLDDNGEFIEVVL